MYFDSLWIFVGNRPFYFTHSILNNVIVFSTPSSKSQSLTVTSIYIKQIWVTRLKFDFLDSLLVISVSSWLLT